MSGRAILTRILCAITVLSFAVMAVCLTFVVPAGAVEHTGWDFDFNVQPAVINVGQMVNVSVHTYYFANDSHGKPFQADASGVTVTITSAFFNTIEPANSQGWLINADHPDVPGNYTYTANVIFDGETKTKTVTLVVYPAGTATTVPVSGSPTPTITPTPQPSPSLPTASETGTPTPVVSAVPAVTATPTPAPTGTPVPTKSPSGVLTILGTISALTLVGVLARKKK
jgi:hypothetical protein